MGMELGGSDARLAAWLERMRAQLREPPHVTLMHVVAVGLEPYGEGLQAEHRQATEALAHLGADEVRVELGSPGKALADASAGYDLLVVGGGGRSMLGEALLGSVSQFVTHHAACPVLVVRPQ
jgi:nucleotide-binding universal stress UspA family protein